MRRYPQPGFSRASRNTKSRMERTVRGLPERFGREAAARDQIAVPAQHRIWTHQQPHPAQHLRRQTMRQRRQERSIARGEPHPVFAELTLKHRDLMAQGEDLHILVPVAHR